MVCMRKEVNCTESSPSERSIMGSKLKTDEEKGRWKMGRWMPKQMASR